MLALLPVTRDHLDALITGDAAFTEQFGFAVSPGYLEFPDYLSFIRDSLPTTTVPWLTYLIVTDDTLVGMGGFKSAPQPDGWVEIGYGLAPAFQGRGFATDAVRQMLVLAAGNVSRVRAHTLPENGASVRVLEKAGFTRVPGLFLEDPDDGMVWRWEIAL